jgi:hypothetical protein
MIIIVLAILVIELIRLWLAVIGARRVNELNKRVVIEQKLRAEEWEKARKQELDDLKQMALSCDTLAQILKDM